MHLQGDLYSNEVGQHKRGKRAHGLAVGAAQGIFQVHERVGAEASVLVILRAKLCQRVGAS
jgi:hypothetical protein